MHMNEEYRVTLSCKNCHINITVTSDVTFPQQQATLLFCRFSFYIIEHYLFTIAAVFTKQCILHLP